jgi:hypothetical protein
MSRPFRFLSEYNLPVLLGVKAKNVVELINNIRTVPSGSIYYHTHRFLKQHQYLVPEPPNDFAYWLRNVLNLRELGENIASVNTASFNNIENLRQKFISVIENFPVKDAYLINCSLGDEFQFMSCKTFCLPMHQTASNLKEFVAIVENISINAFYYHIFETQLRLGRNRNDFAQWFEALGYKELAQQISTLDPYTTTLEGLRKRVIELVSKYAEQEK